MQWAGILQATEPHRGFSLAPPHHISEMCSFGLIVVRHVWDDAGSNRLKNFNSVAQDHIHC